MKLELSSLTYRLTSLRKHLEPRALYAGRPDVQMRGADEAGQMAVQQLMQLRHLNGVDEEKPGENMRCFQHVL